MIRTEHIQSNGIPMENPWDSENHGRSSISLLFLAIGIFIGVTLFVTGSTNAQLIPPPLDDIEVPAKPLDPEKIVYIEDYNGLLARLEKISRDYLEYLSDFHSVTSQQNQKQLLKLLIKIKKEAYCIKPDLLEEDLEKMIDDLSVNETTARSGDEKKLYYLLKKLRWEMELLLELLVEDIAPNLASYSTPDVDLMRVYIKQSKEADKMLAAREKYIALIAEKVKNNLEERKLNKKSLEQQLSLEQLEQIEEINELAEELVENIKLQITFSNDDIADIEAPEVLVLPDLEVLPEHDPKKEVIFNYQPVGIGSKTGVSRSLTDSLHIMKQSVPIMVTNHTGNVEINGWDKNLLKVFYDVEVFADNSADAKALADGISIKLQSTPDGIFLEPKLPRLMNARQKILMSKLVVAVPANCPVNTRSSFGEIVIKNLRKPLTLEAKNSEIYMKNNSGGIKSVVTSGKITIKNCSKEIILKNKNGPVYIKGSQADIQVDNSYAEVELQDCQGSAIITNNSNISLINHTGQVDIKNERGAIEVEELDGDLKIENAYKPIYLTDINGDVTVINYNSIINASHIDGKLTAKNESGQIIGKHLMGPLDVNNSYGSTYLTIGDQFAGPSVIESSYGTVNLSIAQNANLTLANNIKGGAVNSSRDIQLLKVNNLDSYRFGEGKTKLELNGFSTTLVLNSGH